MQWTVGLLIAFIFTHTCLALQIEDCLEASEPTVCYHCDSQHDPYCGNPFKFSHYYISKEVYLTECQGCCIKIIHPTINHSAPRIQRSCTETLPTFNFTLKHNCETHKEGERQICLCQDQLCNNNSTTMSNILLVTITFIFTIILSIYKI